MAYAVTQGLSQTFVGAADTSNTRYRFVDLDADGTVSAPEAGGRVTGVRQNGDLAGRPLSVRQDGVSIVETGAAVAAGDSVETDATGRAVAHTTGVAAGVAQEPATAAGQFIAVRIVPVA